MRILVSSFLIYYNDMLRVSVLQSPLCTAVIYYWSRGLSWRPSEWYTWSERRALLWAMSQDSA